MPAPPHRKYQLFAGCAPGLEALLHRELKQLNAGNTEEEPGGVSFTGGPDTIVRINLQSRIADRILVRLGAFKATQLSELQKAASTLTFSEYVATNANVTINAICKKSRLYHSGAVAERIGRAIQRQAGLSTPLSYQVAPDHSVAGTISVQVRVVRDNVTISVDSSGEHLHKRGYRSHVTEAPLRETTAAAALLFCDYVGKVPLINPMCGSGTLAIEGALMASRTSPGRHRRFAFEYWPSCHSGVLEAEKQRAARFIRPSDAIIQATDISSIALDAAIHNANAAGCDERISFHAAEISKLVLPDTPGLIVVNPPWGRRLRDSEIPLPAVEKPSRRDAHTTALHSLYRKVGELKSQNPDWQLCLITSNERLAAETRIDFSRISPPIPMGGVRIRFYLGDHIQS